MNQTQRCVFCDGQKSCPYHGTPQLPAKAEGSASVDSGVEKEKLRTLAYEYAHAFYNTNGPGALSLSETRESFWKAIDAATASLLRERDAFKDFVHQRLDAAGVPKEFPDGPHTKEGCRIGDRLDWVFRVNQELRISLARFEERVSSLLRENQELREKLAKVTEFANRIIKSEGFGQAYDIAHELKDWVALSVSGEKNT